MNKNKRLDSESRDKEFETRESRVTRERLRVGELFESFRFFCLFEFWFGFNPYSPAVRLKQISKIVINERLDLEREIF
jgi:hypothetical protein